MTADEDDSLLRYLNRVSLQVITLLDLDGRFDGGGRQLPAKVAPGDIKALPGDADDKPPKAAKRKLSEDKQEAKSGRQPVRKMTRARRGQQQQAAAKRQKRSWQSDDKIKDQTAAGPQFKTLADEKGAETADEHEQHLQMSNCLHDHEHYMGGAGRAQHHGLHHGPGQAGGGGVVESIIQLDGGHLSSVNLLTLTMGDELGHPLDSHQVGQNGDGPGDLLASPTNAHLSPIDPTIGQMSGLGALQSAGYYATATTYDEFVGHEPGGSAASGPATSGSSSLNENSSSSPLTAQNYPAADGLSQPLADCYHGHHHHSHHHHLHHGHPSQQQHNHQHQHHLGQHSVQQQLQASAHHHQYQPHLNQQHVPFDHRGPQAHSAEQQHQQWLSPLIVHCADPQGLAAAGQHHHAHQQQQPLDQQDMDYHAGHAPFHPQPQQAGYSHYSGPVGDSHSFQQEHHTAADEFVTLSPVTSRATTNATSSNPANPDSSEPFELTQHSSDRLQAGGDNSNQNNNTASGTNDPQQPQQFGHAANAGHHSHIVEHHLHQPHNGHNHQHHHTDHHVQQQQAQQNLQLQHHHHHHHHQHHNHMMHHHLHPGHMMPTLGPFVNNIEPSSVILHDINLASATWASPEDLYSI